MGINNNYFKERPLFICAIVVFAVCLIMFILYLIKFNNGLSGKPDEWDAFGSYFGAITGFLAFGAVLYTSYLSERRAEDAERLSRDIAHSATSFNRQQEFRVIQRYREDSERAIFFQLLDLHIKRANSIGVTNDTYNGFGLYTDKTEDYLYQYLTLNYLTKNIDYIKSGKPTTNTILTLTEIRTLVDKLLSFYRQNSDTETCIQQALLNPNSIPRDGYTRCIQPNFSIELYNTIIEGNPKELYQAMSFAGNIIHKNYGYTLGSYFRNMYYVMDTINNFSDKKNYKKLFRAQLSRYELTLGLFNAVSSNSSLKMVKLLEEFDIFKDVYPEDIELLKVAKEIGIEPSTLIKGILNEYKNDVANKSDNT